MIIIKIINFISNFVKEEIVMAFKLDDLIIDRIQVATAEDFSGNVLYTLTQLQEASISISAESNDVTDKDGNLVKRFWRAKTGKQLAA